MKTVYQEQTDEELIARIRSGERGVTEYLLEKYKPLVKKQARTMYLMGGENEDLIQEGMIGLFRPSAPTARGMDLFMGLPSCVSTGKCIRQCRRLPGRNMNL